MYFSVPPSFFHIKISSSKVEILYVGEQKNWL